MPDAARIERALDIVRRDLLAARNQAGHWTGELSTSALSTATAVSALALYRRERGKAESKDGSLFARQAKQRQVDNAKLASLVDHGVAWLVTHVNPDGGWGDTDKSFSNIATTMLVKAAIHLAGKQSEHADVLARADAYISGQGGIAGLRRRYGKDKTFAVPILTNCTLAGLVEWREVSSLPFELACLPQQWFKFLNLPVVSYALPALIAIGQARFHFRKPWNPILRMARSAAVAPSLAVLAKIQPASGGFLEATPLTSFVSMSLIAIGQSDHPVVQKGLGFLVESVRADGSWPIDTNLATWVTTLAINALSVAWDVGQLGEPCLDWLLSCQQQGVHPYTGAAPGGWAWTDLTGGVPDADDTPGALLALAHWLGSLTALNFSDTRRVQIRDAAGRGILWLLDLQNSDGGWPTFCRGWGALPFDRSGTDLTAHVIRALAAWKGHLAGDGQPVPSLADRYARFDARMESALERGFAYLARQQRADGSWLPLWFGNQYHPEEENPIYGTARVLLAYRDLGRADTAVARRGFDWLASIQNRDGGWGHAAPVKLEKPELPPVGTSPWPSPLPSSVEETSLAVEALLASPVASHKVMIHKGLTWLLQTVEAKRHAECSPLGFYFAKLWYYETMYPLTFIQSALSQALTSDAVSESRSGKTVEHAPLP